MNIIEDFLFEKLEYQKENKRFQAKVSMEEISKSSSLKRVSRCMRRRRQSRLNPDLFYRIVRFSNKISLFLNGETVSSKFFIFVEIDRLEMFVGVYKIIWGSE